MNTVNVTKGRKFSSWLLSSGVSKNLLQVGFADRGWCGTVSLVTVVSCISFLFHLASIFPFFSLLCDRFLHSAFHFWPLTDTIHLFFHKRVIKLTRACVKTGIPGRMACRGYWKSQYRKSDVFRKRKNCIFSSLETPSVCCKYCLSALLKARWDLSGWRSALWSVPVPSCLCCCHHTSLQDRPPFPLLFRHESSSSLLHHVFSWFIYLFFLISYY